MWIIKCFQDFIAMMDHCAMKLTDTRWDAKAFRKKFYELYKLFHLNQNKFCVVLPSVVRIAIKTSFLLKTSSI